MKLLCAVLITGLGCCLAASSARAGAGGGSPVTFHSGAATSLVIKRAANFGNYTHVNLYIDGRWVDNLSYGETYRGVVSAGDHLITMQQTPHLNDAYPISHQRIRLAPGQTSVFTAIWRGGGTRIALERS
ncbi:MAG TPA: hypothetical protein VLI42_08790 [Chthoniobacterales bacterium]|jgi:hypothetical protein|nr:hypothetical protein [Chthoniobacterales bacterium]